MYVQVEISSEWDVKLRGVESEKGWSMELSNGDDEIIIEDIPREIAEYLRDVLVANLPKKRRQRGQA